MIERCALQYLKQWKNCVQICNIICEGKLLPCTMSVHIFKNLEHTKEINEEIIDRKSVV